MGPEWAVHLKVCLGERGGRGWGQGGPGQVDNVRLCNKQNRARVRVTAQAQRRTWQAGQPPTRPARPARRGSRLLGAAFDPQILSVEECG